MRIGSAERSPTQADGADRGFPAPPRTVSRGDARRARREELPERAWEYPRGPDGIEGALAPPLGRVEAGTRRSSTVLGLGGYVACEEDSWRPRSSRFHSPCRAVQPGPMAASTRDRRTPSHLDWVVAAIRLPRGTRVVRERPGLARRRRAALVGRRPADLLSRLAAGAASAAAAAV